jgi:dolichol-phosphate mannosyltransferase
VEASAPTPAVPPATTPSGVPTLVTVVVPTFNEVENIPILIERIATAFGQRDFEIIVVDDDSPDRTWAVVEELAHQRPWLRVIRRLHDRGLSSAVVAGFCAARGDALAVIDADLQHDEAILPALADALAEREIAIGSRYIAGGGTGTWSRKRRFLSRSATRLAQFLLGVEVRDPMSGFFMLRRDLFDRISERLNPRGFKILLEILHHAKVDAVAEVPYTFRNRLHGESKLDAGVGLAFLVALYDLKFGRILPRSFILYAAVGLSGVAVNLGVLSCLTRVFGAEERVSVLIAIVVSMITNFLLNNAITFRQVATWKPRKFFRQLIGFVGVSSIGLVINYAVTAFVRDRTGIAIEFASLVGIAVATLWNYLISSHYVWHEE